MIGRLAVFLFLLFPLLNFKCAGEHHPFFGRLIPVSTSLVPSDWRGALFFRRLFAMFGLCIIQKVLTEIPLENLKR